MIFDKHVVEWRRKEVGEGIGTEGVNRPFQELVLGYKKVRW
jgi:hypothetical protein